MKRWAPRVEQLRQYVGWECKDIPVDLVLAIITQESGGVVGQPGRQKTRAKEMVKNDQGELVLQDRAYGLMQCVSSLLKTWQDAGKTPTITLDDLKGTDERAARAQIILGCWYFANCVRALHLYDKVKFPGHSPGTADDEQLKLALLAYRMGFGAKSKPGGRGLKPKLDKLQENGWPLTLESIAKAFPLWGSVTDDKGQVKWINRPVHFAKTVWNNYAQVSAAGGAQQPGTELAKTDPQQPATKKDGDKGIGSMLKDYWPLLAIAALFIFMKMRQGQQNEEPEPGKEDELEGAAA